MKITVCDVCYRTEMGKLSEAKWRVRKGTVTFHLCQPHKGWSKDKTEAEVFRALAGIAPEEYANGK